SPEYQGEDCRINRTRRGAHLPPACSTTVLSTARAEPISRMCASSCPASAGGRCTKKGDDGRDRHGPCQGHPDMRGSALDHCQVEGGGGDN
ncbi:hypothetical protein C8Q80DRAFT_1290980, partial [Daedaleopsis nitida]